MILIPSPSSQIVTPYTNVSDTYYTLSLLGLNQTLNYHRLSAVVRASNVIGYVESVSDGVMIVPVGPSSGMVSSRGEEEDV